MTDPAPRRADPDRDVVDGREGVWLPRPTPWPLVLALGITLGFAGLVTNAIVTLVGVALVLPAAVGWWREVLPHERREFVPLQRPEEGPRPIEPRPGQVEHLVVGEAGHRVRLPVEMRPYASGLRGGLAGGAAMAAVALAWGLVSGSVWTPVNLLASLVLPSLDASAPQTLAAFDPVALATATGIHAVLSVLVGLVYAALLPTLPGRPLLWGGVVAPIVWSGVAWAALGVMSPALAANVQWGVFVLSQAAFGLAAGWVIGRSEPVKTAQAWPLAARAGIEARGVGPDPEDEA